MCLVYEKPVHTELFKGDSAVLVDLFKPVKLFLQTLSGFLHSLDLELRAFAPFQFVNAFKNIIYLALDNYFLQGNRMKKIEKYVIIDKEGNEAVKMEEVSYEEIF